MMEQALNFGVRLPVSWQCQICNAGASFICHSLHLRLLMHLSSRAVDALLLACIAMAMASHPASSAHTAADAGQGHRAPCVT